METHTDDWFRSVDHLSALAGIPNAVSREILQALRPGESTTVRTVATITNAGRWPAPDRPGQTIQTTVTARLSDLSREMTEGQNYYTLSWEHTATATATNQHADTCRCGNCPI